MPGEFVVIAATDTGAGMTAEVLEKVFDPFFTTKEVGKGTGLGLSMVYGFVQQSGGQVTVDSDVDFGTTVRLYLPRIAVTPALATAVPLADIPTTGETVLLVEDDVDLRVMTKMMLAEMGYRVLEAGTGREALDMLASRAPIDVLLTDVVLPDGLSGPETARVARQRQPLLQVVYMSGYAGESIARLRDLGENAPLLQKPFDEEELESKLRQTIHRGSA